MKNRIITAASLLFTAIIGIVVLEAIEVTNPGSSDGWRLRSESSDNVRPAQINDQYHQLFNQWSQVSRKAEEKALFSRRLAELKWKWKADKERIDAENPEPFITALREIKTRRDGATYGPDYKNIALRKARNSDIQKATRTMTLNWISRGPGNVSGRSRSMAVDPLDPSGNTWFLASVGGGVWKTTNAGDSWVFLSEELPTLSTTSIVIAPSNPDIIYLGTGMGYGRVVDLEGSGVWKSTDHGESWFQLASTVVGNGVFTDAINRIVVDPNDENTLLVCGNNSYTSIGPNGIEERKSGIYRSTDGGETWIQVFDSFEAFGLATNNRIQQIIATPGNFNKLFATVNEVGVIMSGDAGITWEVSTDEMANPGDVGQGEHTYSGISTRIELAIAPSDFRRIYASVERPFGAAQLWMSGDAGANWVILQNNGPDINWHSSSGDSGANGAYTSGWFNNTIAVDPFDENIVFVGGVNLFRINVDPFANERTIAPIAWWFAPNDFNVPTVHGDHHLLTTIVDDVDNEQYRIVCPSDGGLSYSTDGGVTWQTKTGMINTQFYGVDKKPGEDYYIGGTQDNGTWLSGPDPDDGSVWTHVIGGDGFETVWNYDNPDLILGSSQNGFIRRSDDGGDTWLSVPQARIGFSPFITKIANSKADPDLVFVSTFNGVNRSDDFGLTWMEIPLSPWIGYRPFTNIEVSVANPQYVWATSRMETDIFGGIGGIHLSKDGGLTFTDITGNLPTEFGLVESSGLGTHPLDPEIAYLLFSAAGVPKVLKTEDAGQTWEDISGFSTVAKSSPIGFPDVAVFSLLVMPFDPDILWAGTEIGLFVSENGGETWSLAENGFPAISVFEMKIVDNEVIVATYGRGIWSVELPELEDYIPPEVPLSPRLTELVFQPTGEVRVTADLRSEYDSTDILVNDVVNFSIAGNTAGQDTTIYLQVTQDGTITAQVVSYRNGSIIRSSTKDVDVFVTEATEIYSNLLNDLAEGNDFIFSGFTVGPRSGFSGLALHSSHPYPDGAEESLLLKIPIIVSSTYPLLRYRDIVIVEPGDGTDHLESSFFDFVVVEGTNDGLTWKPLAPGYDSRQHPTWLEAYNTGNPGDESMFVTQTIDLSLTFEPGEIIFVRFRLFADGFVNGWGWAIDNIVVQQEVVAGMEGALLDRLKIYPNPVRDMLDIDFALNTTAELKVLSLGGRTHLQTKLDPGKNHRVSMSGLGKGVYILQLTAGNQVYSSRIVKE